jgi:hypothetical protein
MSAAPATAALPNAPEPPPGSTADAAADQVSAGVPTHSPACRVRDLLRKLIAYGQDLARTLQQRATTATLVTVALHFGTRDVALILARIARGLQLANALEARLLRRPIRPDADPDADAAAEPDADADAEPALARAPADRAKRTARRAVRRPSLPDVPTAEEIAAALRHRPVGAVIADICRDLGIVPAHPLWREVMMVVIEHGGSLVTLFRDVMARMRAWRIDQSALDADGWPALPPQAVVACGTGPP